MHVFDGRNVLKMRNLKKLWFLLWWNNPDFRYKAACYNYKRLNFKIYQNINIIQPNGKYMIFAWNQLVPSLGLSLNSYFTCKTEMPIIKCYSCNKANTTKIYWYLLTINDAQCACLTFLRGCLLNQAGASNRSGVL